MLVTPKRSFAETIAALSRKTSSETTANQDWKKFFPFYKAEVDANSVVRFLPDADGDNPITFLVENFTHEVMVNGRRQTVACGKMHGDTCPFCELSAKFYDKKNPDRNETLGKAFYRKKTYIGQVIVLETAIERDPDQLVSLIEFGPQIYKLIMEEFQSGDLLDAPYNVKGGYNFRIRKTQTATGQNSYISSKFIPRQTDLDDALIDQIQLYNLADYRAARVDTTTLENLAMQHLAELERGGAPAPVVTPQAAPLAQAPVAAPAVTAPVTAAAPAATGGMSALEILRARAAAAQNQDA